MILFRITKKTHIGMQVLEALADEEGSLTVRNISYAIGRKCNTVSKVCQSLKLSGYLESKRGPAGGYTLNADVSRLSVADIIAATDPIKLDNPTSVVIWKALEHFTIEEALKEL